MLRRARGSDEEELKEIEEEAGSKGSLRDLFAPGVRAMVLIGLVMAVAQQLIGVNTVIYYAPLVATFFLTLTGAISVEGNFWLYAGFGVAAIVFFVARLPETKNRSLEEISEEVSGETVEAR